LPVNPSDHPYEIEARKWKDAADGDNPCSLPPGKEWLPHAGILAPMPDYLEIIGAWLDSDNAEYVHSKKRERSRHLHCFGWA
jgi:hypothetical protein